MAQNRGQVMIMSVIFFLAVGIIIILGVSQTAIRDVKDAHNIVKGRESYALAEALQEDIVYRLKNGKQVSTNETLALNGYMASSTIVTAGSGKQITSQGDRGGYMKKIQTTLLIGSGASFNYGVQVGAGGIQLDNSSSIRGNVYSNGPVSGAGGNYIYGDVISAGPTGSVSGIHATSSVYAHTISGATIDKNAYYQTLTSTTVGGVKYPGSADQATSSLPISDTTITQWKTAATTGGVISGPCPYRISSGTVTLGPKEIDCDLEILNSATVNLAGMVWVKGNVSISNNAVIQISPSISGTTVAIIADNPSERLTGSKISVLNSAIFNGSGTNSFVQLVSMNTSAENAGTEDAITVKNNISGALLLYAPHGSIVLENSVNLKEVTAYLLHLKNTASVMYDTGLTSVLFTSGPSGGYQIQSWQEVP